MKKLVIMRGISGSGKSTYIEKHYPTSVVCSADRFFVKADGTYNFNPAYLGTAHETSQATCRTCMMRGHSLIVCDNTNTMLSEMKPYLDLARQYGYEVEVIRLVCDPDQAAKRNTHGVPRKNVMRMVSRFQDFEGETLVNTTEES